ncbi:hypothetical protein D3C83_81540 [compost metagenome]
MVGKRDLFPGEMVDARGHLLRLRAVVHEDERGAIAADGFEHQRCDRGPDRAANLAEVRDR